METVRWDSRPVLRHPALICAFKGWNDAAGSATNALEFLAVQWGAERFGSIDPEEFFDFQVTRPMVSLTEGQTRKIDWPEHELRSARPASGEHDVAFVCGAEPNLRWRTFTEAVVTVARELHVELVLSLGALLADVPHTRPVRITGIAADPGLVERLGFSQARYEGPTGIVGVLHDSCARAGLTSASLWAPVPHYVAAVPSPKASLALVRQVEALLGVTVDATELEQATEEYERRLDAAVASEPDVRAHVERLEEQIDEEDFSPREIPSGDSIARDFERFLRQRGDDSE